MTALTRFCISGLLVTGLFALGTASAEQLTVTPQALPDVQRIQTLYESAAYDEAVRALDAAHDTSSLPAEELQTLLRYRVLCLLALDREEEAEKDVELLLTADPLQQLTAADAPPRLIKTFDRVRARILPRLAREQYEAAKALFDSRRFNEAAKGFERVLQLHSSAGDTDERRGTADLETLSAGFLELSKARLSATAAVAETQVKKVFTESDEDVVPPVPIRRDIPAWRSSRLTRGADSPVKARNGRLDIMIGPSGEVTYAAMTTAIDPRYDVLLLEAAKGWKYRPALRNGVPVTYRRTVVIRLTGSSEGATGLDSQ